MFVSLHANRYAKMATQRTHSDNRKKKRTRHKGNFRSFRKRPLPFSVPVSYPQELTKKDHRVITTVVTEGKVFYDAEDYPQQYLKTVARGYCGLIGTGNMPTRTG